jgi:hypothetical protein
MGEESRRGTEPDTPALKARAARSTGTRLGLLGALLLAVLLAPGCYSSHTRMPDRLQTIAVPVFANKTYLEDYTRKLEVETTDAVRRTFLQQNRLKIEGRETADLVLEGDVLRVERTTFHVDRYNDPVEVQMRIVARISLYDVKEAKYLFRNATVANDTGRPSSGTYDLRRGESETVGRQRAIEDLGRNIAQMVLDRW